MKPKGFIHTLVLVLVTGSLLLPTAGCFGDWKGISRSDDEVFGGTFGGYWGVGIFVGAFIQYSPLRSSTSRLTVGDVLESRDLQIERDDSAIAYVSERDLTVVLLHDDTNNVVIELAVPGHASGRFVLPAGELDAPWLAIEVDGQRFSTSENAQVVVELKEYPEVEGDLAGSFRGQIEATDGTLHEVVGSFSGPRMQ